MTTITEINRPACKKIREELNAGLEELGNRLGLTIHAGNASYNDTSVTFKVECVLAGIDRNKEEFEKHCAILDLPKDAYGKTFEYNRQQWRLVGLKLNRPKYPILAEKVSRPGAKYKLPERAVESLTAHA